MSSPPDCASYDGTFSPDIESAIETAATHLLEEFQFQLEQRQVDTLQEACDVVREWTVDECLLIGVSLEDQLGLLESHANDYGLYIDSVDFETLHQHLTGLAALVVSYLGEDRAQAALHDLQSLLDKYDLDWSAVVDGNSYGMFRHWGERDEDPWHVYEYRNLEGEGIHVDLFEYRSAGITFQVRRYLEAGTLSSEEERWDAS